MSKNSKTRRDAKKKKGGLARAGGAAKFAPSILAHLKLDGAVFAAMSKAGGEWTLLVGGETVAGAPDPQTIMGIMQALAYRAESNGNQVSIQGSAKLQPLLGDADSEAAEAHCEMLARKILASTPLPKPRA